MTAEYIETMRAAPIRLGEGAIGRAGVTRAPVQVADIQDDWELVAPQARSGSSQQGMSSLLAVPLVREDRLLGGLVIIRRERGAFSPEVVAMLQTFATQSVLAIHNARLFQEIQRQKQYADALVETSPVAIVTMDLDGTVIGVEPGAERLFGYAPAEALGRSHGRPDRDPGAARGGARQHPPDARAASGSARSPGAPGRTEPWSTWRSRRCPWSSTAPGSA